MFVTYNLGTQDIALGEMNLRVDDGKYHVVRFTRSGANSTLQVDDLQVQTKHPGGRQLTVFNSQSVVQLGGKWNPTLGRVERPFAGVVAGVVYNGLRPLDVAADASSNDHPVESTIIQTEQGGPQQQLAGAGSSSSSKTTKIQGAVRILDSIPFDYRERHPRLFGGQNGSQPMAGTGFTLDGPGLRGAADMVQNTNAYPKGQAPDPGVGDDIIYGQTRCGDPDDDRYYDSRCFSFEGSGG